MVLRKLVISIFSEVESKYQQASEIKYSGITTDHQTKMVDICFYVIMHVNKTFNLIRGC
jgi:hypothetical protein